MPAGGPQLADLAAPERCVSEERVGTGVTDEAGGIGTLRGMQGRRRELLRYKTAYQRCSTEHNAPPIPSFLDALDAQVAAAEGRGLAGAGSGMFGAWSSPVASSSFGAAPPSTSFASVSSAYAGPADSPAFFPDDGRSPMSEASDVAQWIRVGTQPEKQQQESAERSATGTGGLGWFAAIDTGPEFPLVFNEPLTAAQTRAFVDSLAWWPRAWTKMQALVLRHCWKDAEKERDSDRSDTCGGDEGAVFIADLLKHDTKPPAAPTAAELRYEYPLRFVCKLQRVELAGCCIGPDGCRHLARALAANDVLHDLHITDNPRLGDGGCAALSDGLRRSAALRSLRVDRCAVSCAGAEHIAGALPRCGLTALSLHDNHIGTRGARAVAKAVTESRTLRRLDVSDNRFGAHVETLHLLRDAALGSRSLTALDIGAPDTPADAAAELRGALCSARSGLSELRIREEIHPELMTLVLSEVEGYCARRRRTAAAAVSTR